MPAFKYSMLIDYISGDGAADAEAIKGGFSESVYQDSFTLARYNAWLELARARAALLPRRTLIKGLRVQQVDPSGPVTTRKVRMPGGTGTLNLIADIPQMALLVNCGNSGVSNVSRMRLGALPDSIVVAGEFKPSFEWEMAMIVYFGQLARWKFRGVDLTQTFRTVATVAADGLVTTTADLPLAAGESVSFRGVVDGSDRVITGVFKVDQGLTLRTFRVQNWTAGTATGGKVRKYIPIYPTYTLDQCIPDRIVVRKIGRPSSKYVGHKSKKRRRS